MLMTVHHGGIEACAQEMTTKISCNSTVQKHVAFVEVKIKSLHKQSSASNSFLLQILRIVHKGVQGFAYDSWIKSVREILMTIVET